MDYHGPEYQAWLDSLKEGDEVCYHNRWHGYILDTVERITPTRIIKTAKGLSFRGGREQGSRELGYRLQPVTDVVKQSIWRKEARDKVRSIKPDELSDKQLQAILDILGGI